MNNHELGDSYLQKQDSPRVMGLVQTDFFHESIGKAIGGIQIYRSDAAKALGYLEGTRWMEPHRGSKFACCRCDSAWRGWIEERGHAPKRFDGGEPYRIRHSRKGREFQDIDN